MILDQETDDLIDAFAAALRAKAMRSQLKRELTGLGAVDWKDRKDGIWPAVELQKHMEKGDPLDVAILAAFCWYHGIATNAAEEV